jgi:hypothetical protein
LESEKAGKYFNGCVEEVDYIAVLKCIKFYINSYFLDFNIDFEWSLQKCNVQVSLYSEAEVARTKERAS